MNECLCVCMCMCMYRGKRESTEAKTKKISVLRRTYIPHCPEICQSHGCPSPWYSASALDWTTQTLALASGSPVQFCKEAPTMTNKDCQKVSVVLSAQREIWFEKILNCSLLCQSLNENLHIWQHHTEEALQLNFIQQHNGKDAFTEQCFLIKGLQVRTSGQCLFHAFSFHYWVELNRVQTV